MKKNQYEKLEILYLILKEAFDKKLRIDMYEILDKTSWKKTTFLTYYNKKLKNNILFPVDKNFYEVKNINMYDQISFLRLMSQKQDKSEKPFQRELTLMSQSLLDKAIESAYLAIDVYNRPQTKFRTEGYLVLMIIAWTSLLHSIFEEHGLDYYYKDKNGNFIIIDGERKSWELEECVKHYSKLSEATKKNIEFCILLRNKIEHRFVPDVDLLVCSECHSLLYNFEKILTLEYGNGYSISDDLYMPIQLTKVNLEGELNAKRKFHSEHFEEIKTFVNTFRDSLANEIYNNLEYSFKVYLIPKTVNRENKSDMAIEFINFNPLDMEKNQDYMNAVAIIKEKTIQVANQGKYKPSVVVDMVNKVSVNKININFHTQAWKYFEVRQSVLSPQTCNSIYCQYDVAHNDVIYTDAWVKKIIDVANDNNMYNKVKNFRNKN